MIGEVLLFLGGDDIITEEDGSFDDEIKSLAF